MRVEYPTLYMASGVLLAERLRDVASPRQVNWGYSGNSIDPAWINRPAAVKAASNKANAKLRLEIEGVPTPHVMTPAMAELEMSVNPRRMVGREDRTGQGRRVRVAESVEDLRRWSGPRGNRAVTHWCDWVDADEEYRVHVVNGKVIKISEKTGGEGWVRSNRFGWTFRVPALDRDLRRPMRDAAKKAVAALGLEMGAVDVGRNSVTGRVSVFEVNTAPALTDATSNTLDKYVRAITRHWGG